MYMRTTVEINNSLFAAAKKLALKENVTIKALIEEGLKQVIAEHQKKRNLLN